MGKIIKRTEDGTAFYKDKNGQWRATQTVYIRGEKYYKDSFVPHSEKSNYIRSNKAVSLSNEIQYFADKKGVSYNEMKARLGRLKKSYRGAVKYSNIGINKNGRLYDKKTGKFVKETEDLKKLKNEGYLETNFEDYKSARRSVTGSP